jgi:regulation of enolase protein 1 (concanavalin A-like superfamily)
LEQTRTEKPQMLASLPEGVTDARIFRVLVSDCRTGIRLTATNAAPQFVPSPAQYVIYEGTTLTFTNLVTDPDLPFDGFTFTLNPDAPIGITLNPTNGVFTWTPLESQGPSTNRLEIVVADDGSPRLFATNRFTVVVLESNQPPSLGIAGIAPDDSLHFLDFMHPDTIRAPSQWTLRGPGAINAQVMDFGVFGGYGYDSGFFGYQDVAGDFDMRVRVESLEAVNVNSQAGLLVREQPVNLYSRTLSCIVTGVGIPLDGGADLGEGNYFPMYRDVPVAGFNTPLWQGASGGQVPYPNAWIRLRREGSTFYCYRSTNGVGWDFIAQYTPEPAYPGTVRVGICAASGSLQRAAEVHFRDFVNLVTKLVRRRHNSELGLRRDRSRRAGQCLALQPGR